MLFKRIILLVAAILLTGAAHVSLLCAQENIVARVGGIPVTFFELQRQVSKIMPLQGNFHKGVSQDRFDDIKNQALEELIERAYKVQYAINEEISIPKGQIDEMIEKIKKRYPTEEEFTKAIEQETLNGIRASLYRQLLAEKAEEKAIAGKVTVPDEKIKSIYEERKHTYLRPKQFRASHILVKVDPSSNVQEREELQLRAESLLMRAQKGEDFYDLAYYNSDDRSKYVGGDLGVFHMGQTVPAFEDALVKLKVGEISDIVTTRFGYHIIKLTQLDEERQLEFDEVKLKIRTKMEKELREEVYAAWMNDLKNKYPVERIID